MGFADQGAKPSGLLGTALGKMMNVYHTKVYRQYFTNHLPDMHAKILDIGCGGGQFIQFLHQTNSSYEITGVDHSRKMVELAKKVNKEGIQKKKVHILQQSLSDLDFTSDSFNLVTALECIQFWTSIPVVLQKIHHMMSREASFVIINRYPKEGSSWWKRAQLKSAEDYQKSLQDAGFSISNIDLKQFPSWIIVHALK
jgi:2-polyprenyl-3-methyl-5-hydroxy-6-metoxy-1,4-benzoquinol methylase